MEIDPDDAKLLLAEVGRFARERIAEATARPESPIGADVLAELTREAGELGILSPATADGGVSIWEHSDQAAAMTFSTTVSSMTARSSVK